jgi:MFS family permease
LALSAIFVAADFVLGRLSQANERGEWLSYYGVALSIGLLFGPIFSLVLLRLGYSTPTALVSLAVVVALLGIFGFQTKVAPSTTAENTDLPPVSRVGALSAGAAYGFLEAGLVAVFPVLAVKEFNLLPEYCLILVILSAALTSVLWGKAADRFSARKIVHVLLAGCFVGCATLAAAAMFAAMSKTTIAYLSCTFFGALAGGLYPVGFAWLLEGYQESQYGHASGSFARAYGLGSLLGPLATGIAAQFFLSTGVFLAVGAAAGLSLVSIKIYSSTPKEL